MASLEARIASHALRLQKSNARQIAKQQRRAYYTAPGPSLQLLHGGIPVTQMRGADDNRKETLDIKGALNEGFHMRSDLERKDKRSQEEEEVQSHVDPRRQEAEAQRGAEEMRRHEEEEAQRRYAEDLMQQEAEEQRRSEETRQEGEAQKYAEDMRMQEDQEAQRRSEEMRRQEEEELRQSVEEMRRQEEETRRLEMSRHEEETRRQYDEEMRRQEDARRFEEMRRHEEETRRQYDEEMRRQEDARRFEEMSRHEEETRRQYDEEMRRARNSSRSKSARNIHGFHPYMDARRNTEPDQINEKRVDDTDAANQYVLRWNKLQKYSKNVRTLSFSDIPWPIESTSSTDITKEAVKAFLTSSGLMTNSTKFVYWAKKELLRWHPDKFSTSILPIVYEDQVTQVKAAVDQVSAILTDLMNESRLTPNDVL